MAEVHFLLDLHCSGNSMVLFVAEVHFLLDLHCSGNSMVLFVAKFLISSYLIAGNQQPEHFVVVLDILW